MSDFLNIAAEAFADVCEHVGVRDLHCQIGVGGLLDEFSALDGRKKKLGERTRGTVSVVDGALEILLEDRGVDLSQSRP